MQQVRSSRVPYYIFDNFCDFKEIKHFVSTRHGGVGDGAYATLNIGLGTEDKPSDVLMNRRLLSESVGIPLESFVMAHQVHGIHVEVVTKDRKGAGAFSRDDALPSTDAMISNERGLCLFVMGADCVPILFFDPVKRVIGAAHAGWRGTVKKIAVATVQKMEEEYGCSPVDICVAIGPSIGPCCYRIGGEVIDEVLHSFGTTEGLISFDNQESLPILDLWTTNKFQLREIGVPDRNIEIAGICTQCNHHDFFSSRHDKGVTGRFGAGIVLV
ncbi:MAG TPA: peptidoglycan editing factor PgeF [Bacteroidales bacterium]